MQSRTEISDYKKGLDLQREVIERVEEIHGIDEEMARALVDRLSRFVGSAPKPVPPTITESNPPKVETRYGPRPKNYERIVALFVANGNKPLTRKAILEGAKINDVAFQTVVYSTRPNAFIRDRNPENNKEKILHLTEAAYAYALANRKGAQQTLIP